MIDLLIQGNPHSCIATTFVIFEETIRYQDIVSGRGRLDHCVIHKLLEPQLRNEKSRSKIIGVVVGIVRHGGDSSCEDFNYLNLL